MEDIKPPKRSVRRYHSERMKERSVQMSHDRWGSVFDWSSYWAPRNILEPTHMERLQKEQDERDRYARQVADNITTFSRWNNPRKYFNTMTKQEYKSCEEAQEQFDDLNLGTFSYRFSKRTY